MNDPLKTIVRETLLENGFTIKEGETDLKPYVYNAVSALLLKLGVVNVPIESQFVPKYEPAWDRSGKKIVGYHLLNAEDMPPISSKGSQ